MLQMTNAQAQAKTSLYCEGSCRHCLEILILSEALLSTSALPEVSATKFSSLLLPVSCVPLALATKLTPFSIGRHIAFVLQMTSIQYLFKKMECQLWKAIFQRDREIPAHGATAQTPVWSTQKRPESKLCP